MQKHWVKSSAAGEMLRVGTQNEFGLFLLQVPIYSMAENQTFVSLILDIPCYSTSYETTILHP